MWVLVAVASAVKVKTVAWRVEFPLPVMVVQAFRTILPADQNGMRQVVVAHIWMMQVSLTSTLAALAVVMVMAVTSSVVMARVRRME